MQRLMFIIGLELYAVLLACLQYLNGVRTDEAKYLLNIPYPHPPLARTILHTLDAWAYQEIFWRIVFASLVVQSVWFAVKLMEDYKFPTRLAVAFCWLFSTAVLYQAGTIMMAVLTALQGWIFVYFYMRDNTKPHAGVIGLFWMLSLFTAYQAVLFAPVVWSLLCKNEHRLSRRLAAFFLPLAALALYTLTNPLVIASLLIHGQNTVLLSAKLIELEQVWLFGGSIVLSIVGLYGMIRCRLWPVFCSLLLVVAYVFLARFTYYAVLFLPLSMAGCIALIRARRVSVHLVAMGVLIVSIGFLQTVSPITPRSPARQMQHDIRTLHSDGPVYFYGSFGHEWQYESRVPVIRYTSSLSVPENAAVVCVTPCKDVDADSAWHQIRSTAPFVYVRQH